VDIKISSEGENLDSILSKLPRRERRQFIVVTRGAKGVDIVELFRETVTVTHQASFPTSYIKDRAGAGDRCTLVSYMAL
jgi:sugar/nucleoside kinase (ribokinase family)